MRQPVDVSALVNDARAGRVRAIARLISLVEDGSPLLRPIMSELTAHAGRAWVVGLTGAPGVGKSTTTSALIRHLRAAGQRVGVIAVDPTSPFSGGALLGDRIRMQDHATDPGVFIRSMASRGHLGGLAWSTPQAIRILDAVGFDTVLVETVGVGQSEVEVAALTDTSIVLLAPGMGDGIQAAKAGILEIADILVVNKADRPGADVTVRELKHMLALGRPAPTPPSSHRGGSYGGVAATTGPEDRQAAGEQWTPPVLKLVASQGEGVAELGDAIAGHRDWQAHSGAGELRRLARARAEVAAIAQAQIQSRLAAAGSGNMLAGLAEQVNTGATDAYAAADRLLLEVGLPPR
jgi:LAO/AO transport system kinase